MAEQYPVEQRERAVKMLFAAVPVGDGSSGVWSERGLNGPHRVCTLADGGGDPFDRGQPDVSGGEDGGHAGFKRQRCAPER
jgi:hypothetical protein